MQESIREVDEEPSADLQLQLRQALESGNVEAIRVALAQYKLHGVVSNDDDVTKAEEIIKLHDANKSGSSKFNYLTLCKPLLMLFRMLRKMSFISYYSRYICTVYRSVEHVTDIAQDQLKNVG